jgi:hypothetical protein
MTIIINESIETYHDNAAVSASKLKEFRRRGPLYYKLRYIDKTLPGYTSEALEYGKAFDDMMCLGLDLWNAKYAVKPEGMNFSTKEGKAWKAERIEERKEIVLHDDYHAMLAMCTNVFSNALAAKLIRGALPQLTIRQHVEAYGMEMQARPDWLSIPGRYAVDLKTTRDFGEWFDCDSSDGERNGRPIWQFGYHRQAAIVRWLALSEPDLRSIEHYLIVVEKDVPYRAGLFIMTPEYLEIGWREVEADMVRLARCRDKGYWPLAPEEPITVRPPPWLNRRDANESFWNT